MRNAAVPRAGDSGPDMSAEPRGSEEDSSTTAGGSSGGWKPNQKIREDLKVLAERWHIDPPTFVSKFALAMDSAIAEKETTRNEKGGLILGKKTRERIRTLAEELEQEDEPSYPKLKRDAWREAAIKDIEGTFVIALDLEYPRS